jgi:hypothetical protein
VGGLAADADGAADVGPGCSGRLGRCDGLVQPVAGLAVFTRCRFHTEDGFRGSDMGIPLALDGVFDFA